MSVRFGVRRHLTEPRLRRRWFLGIVVGALSLVPLAGTLGYENGFLLSPLAAAPGLAVGVDGVRTLRDTTAARSGALRPLVAHGASELGILAGLALGVLLVSLAW